MTINSIITIDQNEVKKDIDLIIWSMKLEGVRRFFHLRFWESETAEAEFAKRVEKDPRLESVADHSWHICDIILLIGRHFNALDINNCIKLAILHDKLEIFTGDFNPIGRDGTGKSTYAYDEKKQIKKELDEKEAADKYLQMLPESARFEQEKLLLDMFECTTAESKFVKAIDKLQALVFVYEKKKGKIDDKHLKFSINYAKKALFYYPDLKMHYDELCLRIIEQVAKRRSKSILEIQRILESKQMKLFKY